jgi:type III secretion protein J
MRQTARQKAMRRVPLGAIIGMTAFLSACGGEEAIVHGLDEFEANQIMVTLEAKGISGAKRAEPGRVVTWAVAVPRIDAKDAMRLLVANHLPRVRSPSMEKVYGAGSGGLIPTKSEEKAKYLMALQGEIERKLKALPGIVQAHVTVVQPDKDIVRDLDTPPPASEASVAIVYNAIDERGTAAVKEDEVKNLVAASVEDLKPSGVVVVMKRNVPATLVDQFADSGTVEAPVAADTMFGLRLADKRSAKQLVYYAAGALLIAVICLIVGVGGTVRAMTLGRRLSTREAELTSMRKAQRGTQTGLQQG